MQATHVAAIGIGSNLGDPVQQVHRAISALASLGSVDAISRFYRSRPWGNLEQPEFVNAVVRLHTHFEPHALLEALKTLESTLGRVPSERWGPRAIDLDILTYDALDSADEELCLPHPHLFERAFALVPLAEIDASYAQAVAALDPSERDSLTLIDP
ncbi:MAG: 2-amino-4-hydroxy-6-hydroxymethyldihydropteridine diphosphokinase [Vulcanimicrobiaceae bacterium]